MMIKLHFEKISRYERRGEIAECAVPFPPEVLRDLSGLRVQAEGEEKIPPQCSVTARWPGGSVKWLHLSFPVNLPANRAKDYYLSLEGGEAAGAGGKVPAVRADPAGRTIDTGALRAVLAEKGASRLFERLEGPASFAGDEIQGPVLSSGGGDYTIKLERDWRFRETGPYRVIAENGGKHYDPRGKSLGGFTVCLHFTAGHPWFMAEYRISHCEDAAVLPLEALEFRVREGEADAEAALGISNYQTKISREKAARGLEKLIDAEYLVYESNEQIPETLYGTFFADWRGGNRGLCVTIFQAQQNFPKALRVDTGGITVSLMPRGQEALAFRRGMEKTHHVFFHLHNGAEPLEELNIRSLQMQLPDRPALETAVYREAGVFENVFMDRVDPGIEAGLLSRADSTGRAYGILAWGDAVDASYTDQGRGGGKVVWTNNEYDYPHACMLMFARTGQRRFRDKLLAAARHWMDVDICHHSDDPLLRGAQIMHSANHVSGKVVPSHEWVEGLLDYYHQTGDPRGLESALGIGENVLRMLETPMFQKKGEINARETGWALRSLTALYVETGDEKWLEKCEWILGHFVEWKKEFGLWLSPYTSHTAIRVPFMISVAAGSLMRYYRVRPSDTVKDLIISAMDDLLDNARLPDGLFFYKELPSLRHVSVNTIILEALSYAYELSGDKKYLEGGLPLFRVVSGPRGGGPGSNRPFSIKKQIIEDAVVNMGEGTKLFAQSHIPLAVYSRALETAGLLGEV
jgi:hypothetical protein